MSKPFRGLIVGIAFVLCCFYLAEIRDNMLPPKPLQHAEINLLATTLPYVVVHGRANSPVYKYRPAWLGWLEWGKHKTEVIARPAHLFHVAIYFNFLLFTNGRHVYVRHFLWDFKTIAMSLPSHTSHYIFIFPCFLFLFRIYR